MERREKPKTFSPMDTTHKHTNHLIQESSPYLLQHAHNPVDWYPWSNEAFEKAKKENKLVLVSIGYSSCHWCHVMEKESFEDEETAKLMNENFVCIKVDREERPNIDMTYMTAVQIMTNSGGWPLNCFTLLDGRPFYGGTYFPNAQWKQVLIKLSELYKTEPKKVEEYAAQLTQEIKKTEVIKLNEEKISFTMEDAKSIYTQLEKSFDNEEGGPSRAPKFPMPVNYIFLLHYYHLTKNEKAIEHVKLTLSKMAFGGIYDQLGGGFARYSTDAKWKVPHFEKMLYDNVQLVSLYSEAYQLTKEPLYKQIVFETLEFISREMTSSEGGFYSALDADSEGEEGKYYVWKKPELEKILGEKFSVFSDYYNVNNIGFWEHGNYILLRKKPDEEIAKIHNLSVDELRKKISEAKKILLEERGERVRPPKADDKQLTSWNALMLKGYADAYTVFGEEKFLNSALKNADFILTKLKNKNPITTLPKREGVGLYHSYKNGKAAVNGYLEDYSFTMEAFIALYQITFNEKWLNEANRLMDYTIAHFFDKESGMFFFTSDLSAEAAAQAGLDKELIALKMKTTDNVIPASNSSIAKDL
ncbi:MAG: thioredoxin domain-containing protein, partial [Deltaproteobacteria bacterium]